MSLNLKGFVTPTTWRYLSVATAIRLCDSGAEVSLVALVVSLDGRVHQSTAGILVAMLTAPTLLAPLIAEPLARARDPRRMLALAFACFGTSLIATAALLVEGRTVLACMSAAAGGLAGPMISGGLSTMTFARGGDAHRRRRAEALDAATYSIGSTAGPALVAVMAGASNPMVAVLVLGAGAIISAAGTTIIPTPHDRLPAQRTSLGMWIGLSAVFEIRPLRRTMIATGVFALGNGGLVVAVVVLGSQLTGSASSGALLATALGIGNILGSGALIARPLRGEPERATIALIFITGVLVAICATVRNEVIACIAIALVGATSAAQLTTSLAVRSTYAPAASLANVYVTMAGLKMGCAAVGAAMTGALLALGSRTALLVIAGVMISGAAVPASLTWLAKPRRHSV